jgi:hypothetical protein
MNMIETTRLLAKVQACDGRPVGEAMVLAWQETLADVPYPDAMNAVPRHYRESTDFLMPAHLVKLVAQLQAERRRAQLDNRHDAKFAQPDKRPAARDLSAATRRAVAAATGARKPHSVTLRRRDMAGTSWAFSCTCGVNPPDQTWPSKNAARDGSREHLPAAVARGAS